MLKRTTGNTGGRYGQILGRRVLLTLLLVEMNSLIQAALYPMLTPKAGLLLSPDSPCHQDTLRLKRALKNRTLWAEQMEDACAHGVVGGLWGGRFHLGSFDACLAAGAVSPVGARYCLASLSVRPGGPLPHTLPHPHHRHREHRPCQEDRAVRPWDHVTRLDPESDAADAIQGCGLARGSLPLGEVTVALCVPSSCGAEPLQEALQAYLERSSFSVHVQPEHCVALDEERPGNPVLFWSIVIILSGCVVLAPYRGWSAWDWRAHLGSLARPEAPLAGVDLNPLAGIRAVNMILTLGAHRAFNAARMPTSNDFINTVESRTSAWNAVGHHAALLVDTCFFMSGVLLLLSFAARRRHESPIRALINRYLRLTPSYAMVILFYATAMDSLGSGPLWKAVTVTESEACRSRWWTNLLYINNYVPGETSEPLCLLQSWSLAVDMHLFLAGSLVLPLLPLGTTASWTWAWVGLAAAVAPPFFATLVHSWSPMMVWSARALQRPFADPMFYSMYVPTHMRAAPYIVGLVVGCAILRLKARDAKLSRTATLWATWGSLLVMLYVLVSSVHFGDLSAQPPGPLTSAMYASLSPVVWACALGVLIVALVFGEHTAVSGLLRWKPLTVLSRLSYGVYLVHFAVQLLQAGAERNPLHVTPNTVLRSSVNDLFISLVISLWLYVSVEAPVRQLAKAALSSAGRRLTSTGDSSAAPRAKASPPPKPVTYLKLRSPSSPSILSSPCATTRFTCF